MSQIPPAVQERITASAHRVLEAKASFRAAYVTLAAAHTEWDSANKRAAQAVRDHSALLQRLRQEYICDLLVQYQPTGRTVTLIGGQIAAVEQVLPRQIHLRVAAPMQDSPDLNAPMTLQLPQETLAVVVGRRSGVVIRTDDRGARMIKPPRGKVLNAATLAMLGKP